MYNSVSTNYVKVLNNSLLANVGEVMFNKNGLESLTTLFFANYINPVWKEKKRVM